MLDELSAAPHFMVIGFPKTGTTWLFQMLRQHPGLHMPYPRNDPNSNKEFNVWSAWAEGRGVPDLTPADYAAVFAGDGIKGEVSTNYCYSLDCLALIRQHLPEVKFILGLRDPVDAVLSDYYHRIRGTTFIPFERWLADNADDIRFRFNFDQLLDVETFVYFFEDLVADPQRVLADMFRYIGAQPFQPEAAALRFNYRYAWRWRLPHVVLLELLARKHGTENARRMVASPHLRSRWVDWALRLNERRVDYRTHPGRAAIRRVVEPVAKETARKFGRNWFRS